MEENKKGEKSVEKRTHDRNVSVIKDADGNNIVMINDIRFKGKRCINWEEVKAYMEEFVGEDYTIVKTSDIVYIGSDLPDEYTGSEYTESLRGTNAKAKANASMLIRCANDGKMYLYDIIDIKKEMSNSLS